MEKRKPRIQGKEASRSHKSNESDVFEVPVDEEIEIIASIKSGKLSYQNLVFSHGTSIKTLQNSCFCGSESLVSICIPNSLVTIENSAFQNCSKLKHVTFAKGSNLQTIQAKAFAFSRLINISLPNSLKFIDDEAFSNCHHLLKVKFSKNSILKKIGSKSFENCIKIKEFVFPITINSVGSFVFKGCRNLKIIIISRKTEFDELDDFAFDGFDPVPEVESGSGIITLIKEMSADKYQKFKERRAGANKDLYKSLYSAFDSKNENNDYIESETSDECISSESEEESYQQGEEENIIQQLVEDDMNQNLQSLLKEQDPEYQIGYDEEEENLERKREIDQCFEEENENSDCIKKDNIEDYSDEEIGMIEIKERGIILNLEDNEGNNVNNEEEEDKNFGDTNQEEEENIKLNEVENQNEQNNINENDLGNENLNIDIQEEEDNIEDLLLNEEEDVIEVQERCIVLPLEENLIDQITNTLQEEEEEECTASKEKREANERKNREEMARCKDVIRDYSVEIEYKGCHCNVIFLKKGENKLVLKKYNNISLTDFCRWRDSFPLREELVIGFWEEDSQINLLMKYVKCFSLDEIMLLDEYNEQKEAILRMIVDLVGEMRKKSFYFGRYSPENIFFTEENGILLPDFVPLDETSREMFGDSFCTEDVESNDIFSLGHTIFEMFGGKHELDERKRFKPLEFGADFPDFHKKLVTMCTNEDIRQRPTIEQLIEMIH